MHELFDQRRYLIPFRSTLLPQIFCETLVIGGGVAGLRAAVAAAEADGRDAGDVILLSKADFNATNTAWAQGGVAAVIREDDTLESHIRDTLEAGAGLCDYDAVDAVVRDGAHRLRELIDWGVRFDPGPDGQPSPGREGGHSTARIYHTDGDATGREFQRLLLHKARASSGVRIFENCFALDLITPSTEPGSPVLGAITYHPKYGLQMIWARSTILACGGAGQIYRETTNPPPSTADGLALAYRAGAELADMAFVQFHPTTLYLPGSNRPLISEAVRGEGATLVDASGTRFMAEVHERAELAPRDIVARAIARRIAHQGTTHVWLDCRPIENFRERFPGIHATLRRFGLDPRTELIPVHPAAHYMIGGVATDAVGRTTVPGLFAVGETASTGLHGANRLASNSLLEGLVLGAKAGEAARDTAAATSGVADAPPTRIVSDIPPSGHGELDLADVRSSVRSAMWRNIGIERTGSRLADACDMFDFWGRYTLDKVFDEPEGWETQNMLLAGALVARSALWRAESRGCHFRSDFPDRDDAVRVHDAWQRGRPEPAVRPVREAAHTSAEGAA